MDDDFEGGLEKIKNEYIIAIEDKLIMCNDLSMLDFILQLLQKNYI